MFSKNVKGWLASVAMILATFCAWGQNAHETEIKFKKAKQNGVVAEYNHSAKDVENTIRKKLADEGFPKLKSSGGFLTLTGVQWNNISKEKLDVYIKVDGNKSKSTASILLSKGYDNFVTSQKDPHTIDNIKGFLNNLSWETDVRLQEEMVNKMDNDLKAINDTNKDLLSQRYNRHAAG